jgi:hypothetical protein
MTFFEVYQAFSIYFTTGALVGLAVVLWAEFMRWLGERIHD